MKTCNGKKISSLKTNWCKNIKTHLIRFHKWISKNKVCLDWSKLRWNFIRRKFRMIREVYLKSNRWIRLKTNLINQNTLVFCFNSIKIDLMLKEWKRIKIEPLHWLKRNSLRKMNREDNSSLINLTKSKQQTIWNIQTTWNTFKEILEQWLLFEMSKTISETKSFNNKRINSKIKKTLIKEQRIKAMSISFLQCKSEKKSF